MKTWEYKHGETYKEQVRRLWTHISKQNDIILEQKYKIWDLEKGSGMVHESKLKEAEDRIFNLVEKLKRFGLWQGE